MLVRDAWRVFEEFNVNPSLALEALFVQLQRAFARTPTAPAAGH